MRRTLETNICSYILRRHPANRIERFWALDREQLWLSAIVAAELRLGASKLGGRGFSLRSRLGWLDSKCARGLYRRHTSMRKSALRSSALVNPSVAWI